MLCKKIFGKKNDFFWVFINMKKIVRITESELTRLVERVINEGDKPFYLRRSIMIMDYVDESISDINGGDSFEPEDYKDYKSEVLWKTLGSLEFDNDREVDDVEEFFKYMNKKVFNDKIKQGYLNFKK
jgi:hypothetical protein